MKDLERLCTLIGSDIELVQGNGANISMKYGKEMVIKASGSRILKMIYVTVNYEKIKEIYRDSSCDEREAREVINSSVISGKNLRPSMETGFHSFLPKCVIHTHPVYLNSLLCSKNYNSLILNLFKNIPYRTIPYTKPGHSLSEKIFNNRIQDSDPEIYFLQNHGLIVAGRNSQQCLDKTLEIARVSKDFALSFAPPFHSYLPPFSLSYNGEMGFLGTEFYEIKNYLFPDAAVFIEKIKKEKDSYRIFNKKIFYKTPFESASNMDQIIYAHNLISEFSNKISFPNHLNKKDIKDLLDMPEEKYRRLM